MTQINQEITDANNHYQQYGIDVGEIFSILWKGKWIIIVITFLFAISSVGLAIYLPNEYKATAVVKPIESEGKDSFGALSSQLGGLASLAGVGFNSSGASNSIVAMELLKSWGFAENFIAKYDLAVPLLAARGWDQSKNQLIIDDEKYNQNTKSWVRDAPKGKTVEPTSWELFEEYRSRLIVDQNNETGLVNISITHYSPYIAKQWTDLLIQEINQIMKNQALDEANKRIQYLESQIGQTSIAEIKTVFGELVQEQHKTKMLAQVSDEFVFKKISEVKIPEEKDKPSRALICIIGTLLGGLISLMIVLLQAVVRKYR
ncbi:MAG: LPS O-antigen length regulator [Kangiellaceae bacterium]|nr:LPS O-antigen length regulator [Kangiellaceae bacterium]